MTYHYVHRSRLLHSRIACAHLANPPLRLTEREPSTLFLRCWKCTPQDEHARPILQQMRSVGALVLLALGIPRSQFASQ